MQSNEQIYFVTPCETRWFVSTHWWWQGVSQHAHGALPPESIQTWEIKRKETFKIGRKAHLIWLHQLAKYPSLLLWECTLCQWRGGTISCDTKAVSFPALGVGAAGSPLCRGCRGLTQLVQGPCFPTLEKQKNITHKEQQNSQTHHQIFFFCLKVPGNLW